MKKIFALSVFSLFLLSGCSDTVMVNPPSPLDHDALARDGIAPHIWEEPMVDVIDVPPGLDPEGHYYRPAHQSVVEIRQGKWQYYRDKK